MPPPIQIVCPHCHRQLKVAGATSGRQVRCPQCNRFLLVPETEEVPPPLPPRWQVRTPEGKIFGPVPRDELEQWVREGRVHAQCHIAAEESSQWSWASEMFPQLAAAAPPSAGPPPPAGRPPGPVSDKSRLTAGLLGLLLPLGGLYGIHRLYTGHIALGVLMLITCGGCGIWQLIDVILVFAGAVTDADGLPLRE